MCGKVGKNMFKNIKTIWQKFKKWIIIAIFGSVALASGLSGIPQDLYNNLNVKVYTVCDLQETKRVSIAANLVNLKARNPDNSLRVINAQEKASIKSCEIAKKGTEFAGVYNSAQYGVKIEIIGDVKAIEINGQHGIELFAKGWRGTQQLGFGADGTVEIERFRIFNPPILVDDPNGTIIRESINPDTGLTVQRKLREDLVEAVRQVISHNVKIVGKDNNKIVVGKIGNTTSTYYPNVDSWLDRSGVNETFSTIRAGAGVTSDAADTVIRGPYLVASATTNQFGTMRRGLVFFDTSAIPDTDTVDSATVSVVGQYKANELGGASFHIAQGNAASDIAIVTADYAQANHGTTSFGNIAYADFTTVLGTYNDITLNASGLAAISKTGKSKFSFQHGDDLNNSFTGTWTSGLTNNIYFYAVDQAGATSDPKLVVVHSGAAAATGEEYQIIFGE